MRWQPPHPPPAVQRSVISETVVAPERDRRVHGAVAHRLAVTDDHCAIPTVRVMDGVPWASSAAATDRGMGRVAGKAVTDADGLGPDVVVVDHEPDPVDTAEARCALVALAFPSALTYGTPLVESMVSLNLR